MNSADDAVRPGPLDALKADAARVFRTPFAAVLKIEVAGARALWIDGRTAPPEILDDAPDGVAAPDCLWRAAPEVLSRLFSGRRGFENAYLSGRVQIAGDMSVMARLELEAPA